MTQPQQNVLEPLTISPPESSAPLGHQGSEPLEMMVAVVGAGAGLRVVLHPEHGLIHHRQRRHGAVIEIVVGDPHPVGRQGVGIEGKAMVLAGDLHGPRRAAGMVEAAMAIAELVGVPPRARPRI